MGKAWAHGARRAGAGCNKSKDAGATKNLPQLFIAAKQRRRIFSSHINVGKQFGQDRCVSVSVLFVKAYWAALNTNGIDWKRIWKYNQEWEN